ncbi:MAG: type VI secretion system tube protein Hcp [Desulfatitalea sp.]|nr:type VI secretion system tube protein Hcp [Desulfatitalea sp.]
MAFDAFMQIAGIGGESRDDKHQGWIELIRYGIGLRQTVSTTVSSAGGASAGRANFSDFLVRKFKEMNRELGNYCKGIMDAAA